MDIRAGAAKYYDLETEFPDDIPFYLTLIPHDAQVLELGCGTGRVLQPLVQRGNTVHGIDLSAAMVSICREKLRKTGISTSKAQVEVGDITRLSLGRRFEWIIAPYRVMQNLETDEQVEGLFNTIRSHLAPGGSCVLNVFHPNRDPESLRKHWVSTQEIVEWERIIDGYRVTCHSRRASMDRENMVLYPELVYRRYTGDKIVEEDVMKIAMRCYYPDQFADLVTRHGFEIVNRWGGYHGEPYGGGPELVLQFCQSLSV